MKLESLFVVTCALSALPVAAADFKVAADRMAADRQTGSMMASGHVYAVSEPFRVHSESASRDAEGKYAFADPTSITTCSNEVGCLHWQARGQVEYLGGHYLKLRNVWLRMWDVPVFWLPFWYYPMDTGYGWRVMPGYTSRWGAYVMSKYVYRLYGGFEPGELGLSGATRFDCRARNGIALGQALNWQLGDFGRGKFNVYYAWDENADRYDRRWGRRRYNYQNWGSSVPYHRYGVNLSHRCELTERDILRMRLGFFSDSWFRKDFLRRHMYGIKNEFLGAERNEIAWEHGEGGWSSGLSVSGPLNGFYGGTARLPEAYFDIAPTPVFSTPFNYESQTRAGFLSRECAKYGSPSTDVAFRYNPGPWASYRTFRFDTCHRLTLPMKFADRVSVVPRLGWHGTFWGETGRENLTGEGSAGKTGDNLWRSVYEAGMTLSARGRKMLTDRVEHVVEPYLDVLAQEADYFGLSRGNRPYVFDSIDASGDWLDQFAGRGRNLPYSWYGVTPGVRNALRRVDEKGRSRMFLEVDAYASVQLNHTHFTEGDRNHRLARDPSNPNYGRHAQTVPGIRVRWMPADDIMLAARGEYDVENNRVAYAAFAWRQRLTRSLKYDITYCGRDHRAWDYSSVPHSELNEDDGAFNWMRYRYLEVGFEQELCDAVAWGPYIRWDCRDNDLDEVGTWLDLRTDCLGFRFSLSYDNEYDRIDGSRSDDDWRFGFYVYLRAFGPSTGNPFGE